MTKKDVFSPGRISAMSQTAKLRAYIEVLPRAYVFSSRELLTEANRGSVDTFVSRQVAIGFIERVARGMFRVSLPTNKEITPLQAAALKLRAFGKEIVTVENQEASPDAQASEEKVLVVGTNGRSSSFKFGEWRIVCKGLGPRKIRLAQKESGRRLRDLWIVGEKELSETEAYKILSSIPRREYKFLPPMHKYIPQWLAEVLSNSFSERLALPAG